MITIQNHYKEKMISQIKFGQLHYLVAIFFIFAIFGLKISKIYQNKKVKVNEIHWTVSLYQKNMQKPQIKRGVGFNSLINQKVQKIETLTVEIANLTHNQIKVSIPQQLSIYKFSNLNRLDVRNNKIESIQSLVFCQLPNLQFITLTNNLIFCLKSLRRIEAQNIIWLQLSNNPIVASFYPLSEMSLPNLQFLWIQFFGTDLQCNSDINWIAKCQSQILQKFHINNSMRVLQLKTIASLKGKYEKLDVRVKQH